MTCRSKKEKDYQHWKSILNLKDKGFHYVDEGLKLIKLIISQMNNRRLSTSGLTIHEKTHLDADIHRLLSGPSNYDKREHGIWIISENKYLKGGVKKAVQLQDENGNILNSFNSITDCAKFLRIPPR